MDQPSIYFPEVNERQGEFHRRLFLVGGATGAGLLALTGRLGYLQLVKTQHYNALAQSNQFNFQLVTPPRGRILDRGGVVLATNRANYRLMLSRQPEVDFRPVLDNLAALVNLDPVRCERLAKELKAAPIGRPVSISEDLTWEQFSGVNIRYPELPGVTADMGEVRVYPYPGAFAHIIGYVAKISDRDLAAAKADPDQQLLHNPAFRIGKQGVEKALDRRLRGRPGAKKVEVDARGRVIKEDPTGNIPAQPGAEVRLTLDADVQTRALEVMGEESGAIVVMDCVSGDLLCMVSTPSFDANRFVKGASGSEYRALADYERKPLLDKVMSGTYPPGSTFKPTVGLAALEAGVDPSERIVCTGGWSFGGRVWHCHKKGGHGSQNLHEAIKNSCDVYFYQMALRIGPDPISRTASALGFGHTFDIGTPGQRAGIVGSRAWKQKAVRRDPTWHPGDSVSFGIGQGYINVNPLQLAVMTARLANARRAVTPRLIQTIDGVEQPHGDAVEDLPFRQENLQIVRAGMAAVANDPTGGAYKQSQLGLGDIKMAGKTGTAQVRAYAAGASRSNAGVPWRLKDHNLFVAFAPYDAPRYALSVLVEHGGSFGSLAAAPRAREVMRVALLKDPEVRKRIEQLPPTGPEAEVTSSEQASDAPGPLGQALISG